MVRNSQKRKDESDLAQTKRAKCSRNVQSLADADGVCLACPRLCCKDAPYNIQSMWYSKDDIVHGRPQLQEQELQHSTPGRKCR